MPTAVAPAGWATPNGHIKPAAIAAAYDHWPTAALSSLEYADGRLFSQVENQDEILHGNLTGSSPLFFVYRAQRFMCPCLHQAGYVEMGMIPISLQCCTRKTIRSGKSTTCCSSCGRPIRPIQMIATLLNSLRYSQYLGISIGQPERWRLSLLPASRIWLFRTNRFRSIQIDSYSAMGNPHHIATTKGGLPAR